MRPGFPLVLLLISCLPGGVTFAADPPSSEAFAPPESFAPEQQNHWAYQIPTRPALPDVKDNAWGRNPIDRFILAQIEEFGFEHAPEAERVDLIRRVTYDLTGLPPTPGEVQAFLEDDRPDAYERVVDRLLASSRYGERWAQHWLDLAHYADTNGFELDAERPDAWRYRDWVVRAYNSDMPYDRFVTLQLAGDEAEPGDHNALIATGFGRCGPREVVGGNIIPEVKRQSELTEITTTVSSVFLGLTMGCARCHDHKFDAIPTTDYYRLQAIFAGVELTDVPIASKDAETAYGKAVQTLAEATAPLKKQMAELEAPFRDALRTQKRAALTEQERAVLDIPESERTATQKKMAEGAQLPSTSPGKKSRRPWRGTPRFTRNASGSSGPFTRSRSPVPILPRRRWPWSRRGLTPPRPSPSCGEIPNRKGCVSSLAPLGFCSRRNRTKPSRNRSPNHRPLPRGVGSPWLAG